MCCVWGEDESECRVRAACERRRRFFIKNNKSYGRTFRFFSSFCFWRRRSVAERIAVTLLRRSLARFSGFANATLALFPSIALIIAASE